jgi:two-component system, chemotaxis family, response regulator Rcp1
MEQLEVLLVEDNPADVLLVRVALSQLSLPLKLQVAGDGEQALKMLSSPDFHPQLIILDLNMPRIDGPSLLRKYPERSIPIVVFSSSDNKAEVQQALALGARECVRKPIGFEPYANAVRSIVERWAEPEIKAGE